VRQNKGAPGIDGMTVDELPGYLKHHWPDIRAQLETGRYRPRPVKRVDIPKGDGKTCPLGIPTVLDRFIQQALAQVLSAQWEPHFHPHSYGFRPGSGLTLALLREPGRTEPCRTVRIQPRLSIRTREGAKPMVETGCA